MVYLNRVLKEDSEEYKLVRNVTKDAGHCTADYPESKEDESNKITMTTKVLLDDLSMHMKEIQ